MSRTLREVPRLRLVHGPTPLVCLPHLSERLALDLWIKRDDMTGGVEAGNKLRKLEYLFADARAVGADTVITCGALQSNHARATAVVAASHGLRCSLLLRTTDPSFPPPLSGNLLISRMVGAKVRLITEEQYADRQDLMQQEAHDLERAGSRPYVIPEGGSNGLGVLGYVAAMGEVATQLELGLAGGKPFDLVVVACGSGGTAAGVALGAAAYRVADEIRAVSVRPGSHELQLLIERLCAEARSVVPALPPPVPVSVDDSAQGPAYGMASPEQRRFIVETARSHGLVLDPVYTGKALFGLARAVQRDGSLVGRRVLFLHTGGLPGLLALGEAFASDL